MPGPCKEMPGPGPNASAKRHRSCTRATADDPCRHYSRGGRGRGLHGRRGRRVRRPGSCGGVHLNDLMQRWSLAARVARALMLHRESVVVDGGL
jgi:hypothetical protein